MKASGLTVLAAVLSLAGCKTAAEIEQFDFEWSESDMEYVWLQECLGADSESAGRFDARVVIEDRAVLEKLRRGEQLVDEDFEGMRCVRA